MDLLTQLLVSIGVFLLGVVVGAFIGIMIIVIEDMIDEKQQARERNERRE